MSPFRELMTGISWAAEGERGWQWESALKNKKGRAAVACSRTRTIPPLLKCSPLRCGNCSSVMNSPFGSELVDKQMRE